MHELVVVLGSQKKGGTGIENEDWRWLGAVLLAAASQEPKIVIPQIALLLTDGNREPGRRGGTVYTSIFNDVILGKVFDHDRMIDLTLLLGKMNQQYGSDTETRTHVACCQGWAREWLKANDQGQRENAP
ncbi:MAG: hypothetical protein NTZ17_04485 [Phycisphaerae bacterium]|nr:hypothetical protein [Phycisphaerae bacterium]